MEQHRKWKHAASAALYTVLGLGLWKGGVNEPGKDGAGVIVQRRSADDEGFEVVPGHYMVANVRSADTAVLQSTKELQREDRVVVYKSEQEEVFARRYEDFFDGRFVKVDDAGNELDPPKASKKSVGDSAT